MKNSQRKEKRACYHCDGEGTIKCTTCYGRGGRFARRYRQKTFDYTSFESGFEWEPCITCDGAGRIKCSRCHGNVTLSYEIGGTESPTDSTETVTLPENLSRKELVSKIHNTRNETINCIDRCDSLDIVDTTRRWADELLKIDLFNLKATKEIRELRSRVDKLEKRLPVTFSLYHPGTISTLLFIPAKLRDLEELCAIYQDKFGSK